MKYIKVSKLCSDSKSQEDCGIAKRYKYNVGNAVSPDFVPSSTASVMLPDGIGVMFLVNIYTVTDSFRRGATPALQSAIAWIIVDINGKNPPNRFGKDFFPFYLTDYGVIPAGTPEEKGYRLSYGFSNCKTYGFGCTAWVLKQKNMKYLHSTKCSWTNTSCR